MTFLQDFSQWGRRKVQKVSTAQEDLRVNFLHYIMGRLPELDRTRFEERLLEDQDFSDAAAACEQELIDAYALHRLDVEEARAVRLWIEASPERVQRVAIARAFLQATPMQSVRRRQIGIALAIAACLLLAASLYLATAKIVHRPTSTQLSAASTLQPQNQTPPPITEQREAATPDIVLIAAERVRGEQKPTTYQVHRNAPIQLQILLPSEAEHSGYQVRVTTLADPGKVLLQQNDLKAQSLNGQLYLTVTLPPGSLPPATYTASISKRGETLLSTFTLKWTNPH